MTYWVDIIEDIVDRVIADSGKPAGINADAPYFMHGHPLDIIAELQLKEKSDTYKSKKFPTIILIQDFEEEYGDSMIASQTSLNVVIATNTDPNYLSSDRYTNNFKPILYPLYELFLEKLVSSKQFRGLSTVGLVPHRKTDRLFWGKQGLYGNEGNIFNDYIDAIEINDLKLQLNKIKYC